MEKIKALKSIVILAILALVFSSCAPKESATPNATTKFDPRISGGIIGSSLLLRGVTNMSVINSYANTLRIQWKNPGGYDYLDFHVKLFRLQCDFEIDHGCKLDTDPLTTPGIQVVSSSKESLIDDPGLVAGTVYSYFACVYLNTALGPCSIKKGAPKVDISEEVIPLPLNFWEKITLTTGQSASSTGGLYPATIFTMNAGKSEFNQSTKKAAVTGKLHITKSGMNAYYADTDNNRVIVMTRGGNLCNRDTMDSDSYSFCLTVQASMPWQVVNILGQPNQYSIKSCQQHQADATEYRGGLFVANSSGAPVYNRCLTRPTAVFADEVNQKLLIVDSGNDRIVGFDGIITDEGCDPSINPLVANKVRCDMSFVIGKSSLKDLSAYPHSSYGDRTFNNPLDIKVRNNDLFVVDSGNHRVIKISKYASGGSFNCTESSWPTTFCRFTHLLGQPSFFSRESLRDLPVASLFVGTPGNESRLSNQYRHFLKNHFANPTGIEFTDDGKLIVSAFEDFMLDDGVYTTELRGRILTFDEGVITKNVPDCTPSNFNDAILGKCFAVAHFGLINPEVLPRIGSGSDYLLNVAYGLDYISAFTVFGTSMTAASPVNSGLYVFSGYGSTAQHSRLIQNPQGQNSSSGQALPNLKGASQIFFDSVGKKFYVSDPLDSKIYELNTSL